MTTLRTLSDKTLAALIDGVPEAVLAVDEEGRIVGCNRAAEAALDLLAADITGHLPAAHPHTAPLADMIRRAVTTGQPTREPLPNSGHAGHTIMVLVTPAAGPSHHAPRSMSRLLDQMREIVHELKLPISSAKSFIDLIEATGEVNTQQAKWAERARLSLISMLSLVHELLDMAWLESGAALTLQSTDLCQLAERALAGLENYAHYREVDLSLDIPPEGCTLHGDESRLEGAITNLVSNAIKYSPDGGPVRLVIRRTADTITLRVEDRGIGIAPEHIPHLFQPFYRVQTAATRRIEGSGLGLSIVKGIVEKHGGTVFVESAPGEGSVFGFTLPVTNGGTPIA
ncbi:MAG: HAMP domain-containing histidine kinase [Anaerolineae bacterium]|nr:HAMP domain-containing histidine kinase [Anaerolineae bacterium]